MLRSATDRESVSPAVAPPPGNERFPRIDGLRAVAALSVVAYHCATTTGFASHGSPLAKLMNHLDIGVTLFFLISGFLLYRPFVSHRVLGTPNPGWRRFARRRVLRIVPAYWVALSVFLVWPGLPAITSHNWPVFYGFGQIYSHDHVFSGLSVAWSLCTEATFYLLLPLYATALMRFTRSAPERALRGELVGLASAAVVSVVIGHEAIVQGNYGLSKSLAGTFDWFALGMGAAAISCHRSSIAWRRATAASARGWLCWLTAGALFAGAALTPTTGFTHVLYGITALAFMLPTLFAHERRDLPRRILGSDTALWLGLVSYGIYLWHEPLAQQIARHLPAGSPGADTALLLVPAFAAAIAAGALSYRLVELPFLRLKEPRRHRA